MHRSRSRRPFAVSVAATALLAGSQSLAAPPTSATPAADGVTLVASCSGDGPGSIVSIRHRFGLPGSKDWTKRERRRSCRYVSNGVSVRVAWTARAGSPTNMRRWIERTAAHHRGFTLIRLHDHGKRFDRHAKRTTVAEFSYKSRSGTRYRARAVGDKYTRLVVSAPKRTWKRWAKKAAHGAHRSMSRTIAIA